jgi:hypothetical protein
MGAEEDILGVLLIAQDLIVQYRDRDRKGMSTRGLEFGPSFGHALFHGPTKKMAAKFVTVRGCL